MRILPFLLAVLCYNAEAQFGFPKIPSVKFPTTDFGVDALKNTSIPGFSDLPKIPIISDISKKDFGSFKSSFNKAYKNAEEEAQRLNIFAFNKEKIDSLNQLLKNGLAGFKVAANIFSDLTHEEFTKLYNGFGQNLHAALKKGVSGKKFSSKTATIPDHVDWREKGAVTPVKFQGGCASCWAFAAAGALEAQNYKETGKLNEVSAQNLVDCSTPYGSSGCLGGLMDHAFKYVIENKGVLGTDGYPYEAKNGDCRFKEKEIAASCKGFVSIPENDEKTLENAVANVGPVSVAINANLETFQFYAGGIYDDPKCDNQLNHAVLIVGYGEEDGKKYWIIKNSYSDKWGENGYMKITRGKNLCGIAVQASFPQI